MSITTATIITDLDTHIGDTSTDRVSAAERLAAITEATVRLQELLKSDHNINTYELDFLDSVHYYKVTTAIPDLMETADLRIKLNDDHDEYFTKKSPQELAIEIGEGSSEDSYTIERRDGDTFIGIVHNSKYSAKTISSCDATDAGGGTWAVDATNSDSTNLTIDTNEFQEGTGSFNFDIDESQSGNDRATIQNSTLSAIDMSDDLDLSSFIFRVYIPDVSLFTTLGFTVYWGSSSTAYWSGSVTTDIDGSSFSNGWNKVKVNWVDATKTGSPDESAIDFVRIDLTYAALSSDDTDFRIDDIKMVRPEPLKVHYLSWYVGTNTGGSQTASEYSMSRAQAQQRLQTPWKMLTVWWKTIFEKIIPAYMNDLVEDEKFVMKSPEGGFANVFIRKAELQGKIGSIELEASDQLPSSWLQMKDVVLRLIELNNPVILESLTSPENLPFLAEAIGLNQFIVPGEADRKKQYEEISLLLNSEPLQSEESDPMNPTVSIPIELPSISIDKDIDNHKVEAAICRSWLVSEAGQLAKTENPLGYKNVLLHLRQHIQIITEMMLPPQQVSEETSTKETI